MFALSACIASLSLVVGAGSGTLLQDRDLAILFEDDRGDPSWRFRDIPAFQPTQYAVLFGYDIGPISGWEASITIADPAWNMSVSLIPESALNVGEGDSYIVGLGGCFEEAGLYRLARIGLGYYAGSDPGQDVLLCPGTASPSSFDPAVPGYSSCTDDLIPFQLATYGCSSFIDGCAVINWRDIVPSASTSWAAVKASY